jgi:hypothetical protein
VSTILKALKRLDEERRADAAPKTLEEQVLGGGARREAARRPNKRIAVLASVGLGLIGGAAYWIATRAPEPPPAAAPQAQHRPTGATAAAIARAPREALPQPGAPLTGTAVDAGVREQLVPEPVRGAASGAAGGVLPAAGHQPEPGVSGEIPPETRLAEQRARAEALRRLAAQRASEQPATAGPLVTTSAAPRAGTEEPETPREVAVARSEPASETPPAPTASALPTLAVERTQWHPAAEKRVAWVRATGETRELREGDVIEGAIVREIRPSSVLFSFEGAELRRGVGER